MSLSPRGGGGLAVSIQLDSAPFLPVPSDLQGDQALQAYLCRFLQSKNAYDMSGSIYARLRTFLTHGTFQRCLAVALSGLPFVATDFPKTFFCQATSPRLIAAPERSVLNQLLAPPPLSVLTNTGGRGLEHSGVIMPRDHYTANVADFEYHDGLFINDAMRNIFCGGIPEARDPGHNDGTPFEMHVSSSFACAEWHSIPMIQTGAAVHAFGGQATGMSNLQVTLSGKQPCLPSTYLDLWSASSPTLYPLGDAAPSSDVVCSHLVDVFLYLFDCTIHACLGTLRRRALAICSVIGQLASQPADATAQLQETFGLARYTPPGGHVIPLVNADLRGAIFTYLRAIIPYLLNVNDACFHGRGDGGYLLRPIDPGAVGAVYTAVSNSWNGFLTLLEGTNVCTALLAGVLLCPSLTKFQSTLAHLYGVGLARWGRLVGEDEECPIDFSAFKPSGIPLVNFLFAEPLGASVTRFRDFTPVTLYSARYGHSTEVTAFGPLKVLQCVLTELINCYLGLAEAITWMPGIFPCLTVRGPWTLPLRGGYVSIGQSIAMQHAFRSAGFFAISFQARVDFNLVPDYHSGGVNMEPVSYTRDRLGSLCVTNHGAYPCTYVVCPGRELTGEESRTFATPDPVVRVQRDPGGLLVRHTFTMSPDVIALLFEKDDYTAFNYRAHDEWLRHMGWEVQDVIIHMTIGRQAGGRTIEIVMPGATRDRTAHVFRSTTFSDVTLFVYKKRQPGSYLRGSLDPTPWALKHFMTYAEWMDLCGVPECHFIRGHVNLSIVPFSSPLCGEEGGVWTETPVGRVLSGTPECPITKRVVSSVLCNSAYPLLGGRFIVTPDDIDSAFDPIFFLGPVSSGDPLVRGVDPYCFTRSDEVVGEPLCVQVYHNANPNTPIPSLNRLMMHQ